VAIEARAAEEAARREVRRLEGEARELSSALAHFEATCSEELSSGRVQTRQLKADLERSLAEEQKAHARTRKQLGLYKLAASMQAYPRDKAGAGAAGAAGGTPSGRGGGLVPAAPRRRSFWRRKQQRSEKAEALALTQDVQEELNQHAEDYRNIINIQSAELETLKERLKATSRAMEQVGVPVLRGLLQGGDDLEVKKTALQSLANVATAAKRGEIVEAGLLATLLETARREEDETINRLAAALVANIAMDPAHQEAVVLDGWLPMLVGLSHSAEDPQTLRMVAGALANLCANAGLRDHLDAAGAVQALVQLTSTASDPDVRAQVARGVANWVLKSDRVGEFITERGGLACLLAMAGSGSDISVKKHAGIALYHIALTYAAVAAPRLEELGGLGPLEDLRKCASPEVGTLASRTLALLETARKEQRPAPQPPASASSGGGDGGEEGRGGGALPPPS